MGCTRSMCSLQRLIAQGKESDATPENPSGNGGTLSVLSTSVVSDSVRSRLMLYLNLKKSLGLKWLVILGRIRPLLRTRCNVSISKYEGANRGEVQPLPVHTGQCQRMSQYPHISFPAVPV